MAFFILPVAVVKDVPHCVLEFVVQNLIIQDLDLLPGLPDSFFVFQRLLDLDVH